MKNNELLEATQQMLNLNQKELGAYIGVGTRTVNSWMTGDRQCASYVAEMAYRLATVDAEALKNCEPTTGMYRWAVIDDTGSDVFLTVCGSHTDAIREGEMLWSHMTNREKNGTQSFMVGLIHVCVIEDRVDGCHFSMFENENGQIDSTIYEVAKQYK